MTHMQTQVHTCRNTYTFGAKVRLQIIIINVFYLTSWRHRACGWIDNTNEIYLWPIKCASMHGNYFQETPQNIFSLGWMEVVPFYTVHHLFKVTWTWASKAVKKFQSRYRRYIVFKETFKSLLMEHKIFLKEVSSESKILLWNSSTFSHVCFKNTDIFILILLRI